MATAEVKKAYEKTQKPLCVGDGSKAEWIEDVFQGNPKIAKEPYLGCFWVRNFKGYRPYIKLNDKERIVYERDFKAEPGEVFLSDEEKKRHADKGRFILIEPNTKTFPISKNKRWPIQKWQAVVDALKGEYTFLQLTGKYKIQGIPNVGTRDFRDGMCLLYASELLVTTDGGLHHAAAALGKKAVVIWGGLASPKNLGYDTHINLHAGSEPCGSKMPCIHCQYELEKITPDMVVNAIRSVLGEGGKASPGAGSEAHQEAGNLQA